MLTSNPLGAALAPLIVVGVMAVGNWRTVFHLMFLPGLLMAILFWLIVKNRPAESGLVSPKELAEIEDHELQSAAGSEMVEGRPSYRDVFLMPNALKYMIALFFYDLTLGGFRTWLPMYLVNERGFSMLQMGVAASMPAFAGIAGSIIGGFVSDRYFTDRRKFPIVVAQIVTAILMYLIYMAHSTPWLIISQTLAGFFLSFFVATFWALPMTTVPKRLMGITTGFLNTGAQIATSVAPIVIGYLVGAAGGSFAWAFTFLIGCTLLSAIVMISIRPAPIRFPSEEPPQ